MDASEAAGPIFARAQQRRLIDDEDFVMQIDAHSVFMKEQHGSFHRVICACTFNCEEKGGFVGNAKGTSDEHVEIRF